MGLAFYQSRAVQNVKGQSKRRQMLPFTRCYQAECTENVCVYIYNFKSLMNKQNLDIRIYPSMKILLLSTLEKFREIDQKEKIRNRIMRG